MKLTALGMFLLAAVSVAPLMIEPRGVGTVDAYSSALLEWMSKIAVIVAMGSIIAYRAWADRTRDRLALALHLGFVLLAAALTAWHWYAVDRDYEPWQRQLYLDILSYDTNTPPHDDRPEGTFNIPHQARPLPYGFTRSLEWVTGDWLFSCLAYRWFFTYWFVWGSYQLARLYLTTGRALLALVPLVVLFPLSIAFYAGQLTDPMSHAFFVAAYLHVARQRWLALAAVLELGILAKETIVLVALAAVVRYWYGGLLLKFLETQCGAPLTPVERDIERLSVRALALGLFLGVVCVAAFLAPRLPLGWRPGASAMNGTDELMIRSNLLTDDMADQLGVARPMYRGAAPLWHNYLHPLLFVGVFLPFIAWRWWDIDSGLKCLFLTVTPLLLLSSLCFSWLYESRNYMPLVPLLATMALTPRR